MQVSSVLSTFLLLFSVAPAAYACSCASSGGCKFLPNGDAIFLGTVISQHTGDAPTSDGLTTTDVPQTTVFSVKESFAGNMTSEVTIDTGDGMCSYHIEIGRSYLVVANRFKGQLTANKCQPNQPEERAEAAIEQLRNKVSGRQVSSLFGEAYYLPIESWAEGEERKHLCWCNHRGYRRQQIISHCYNVGLGCLRIPEFTARRIFAACRTCLST